MPVTITVDQLGVELRRRRKEENLTLRDVESDIGVSAATLSRMERGQIPRRLSVIRKLGEWLEVKVEAVGEAGAEIETDEDLIRSIEVHLRAKKDLPEKVAKAIAESFEIVMDYELEKEKRRKGKG